MCGWSLFGQLVAAVQWMMGTCIHAMNCSVASEQILLTLISGTEEVLIIAKITKYDELGTVTQPSLTTTKMSKT